MSNANSDDRQKIRVDCTECPFSKIVDPDDDELPADVVVEHGQQTGHKLSIDPIEE